MSRPLSGPPIEALEAFASHLPRGAAVLCDDPQVASWLNLRGFEIQVPDPAKDLRLTTLKRESLDGIWAATAFAPFSIEDAQRVVAAFFQALKPKTGVFFASHTYPEAAFESMIRQNGFRPQLQAQRESWIAVLAQRI